MSFKQGAKVKVVDESKVNSDEFLEESALSIIRESGYKGEVTKVIEDEGRELYFVGFKNSLGWVTQGFREDEIEGVK